MDAAKLPDSGQPGWLSGLRLHYAEQRRTMVFTTLFFAAAAFASWAYSAAPFLVVGRFITGRVTGVQCGSKGYGYTYTYEVAGVRYYGASGWGGIDGNRGHCSSDLVGQDVVITYNGEHPGTSIGGTPEGRGTFMAILFAWVSGFLWLVIAPIEYVKARRKRTTESAGGAPRSLSRQQRRAIQREQQKHNRTM